MSLLNEVHDRSIVYSYFKSGTCKRDITDKATLIDVKLCITGDELKDLSELDITDVENLSDLPTDVKSRLKKAVSAAKDKKLLNLWLHAEYNIPQIVIHR